MRSRGRGPALLFAAVCAAFVESGARRLDADTKVSEVLAAWMASPTDEGTLEQRLVALGADAEPDLARLVVERAAETEAGDGPPMAPLARALARVAGSRSVASLGSLARSARGSERAAAVAALATVPTEESLAIVVAALSGESPEAAEAAVAALPKLATLDPERLSAGRLVTAMLDSPRPDLAARVLGLLRTTAAHDALLVMLKRSDPTQQLAALDGLQDGATADDLESVRPFLVASKDVALRKSACMLLGRLHDAASVDDLIELLKNADEGLAANAHWALGEITTLHLGNDPQLWSAWWEGGGSEQYGAPPDSPDQPDATPDGAAQPDATPEVSERPDAAPDDSERPDADLDDSSPSEPSTVLASVSEDEDPPSRPAELLPIGARSPFKPALLGAMALVGASTAIIIWLLRRAPADAASSTWRD
jgi:HEAT repeat protein